VDAVATEKAKKLLHCHELRHHITLQIPLAEQTFIRNSEETKHRGHTRSIPKYLSILVSISKV
jgi:hypothetical protein